MNKEEMKSLTLAQLVETTAVSTRLQTLLGKDAERFKSTLITIAGDPLLRRCDKMTIFSAAITAAQLGLSINKQQGMAYILPYGTQAQFQIGYKGWIQLCLATGRYEKINAVTVYEGQLKDFDPLTEDYIFDWKNRKSDKPIGYAAYFKTREGFSKILYWTREQCEQHARRYSKGFTRGGGVWSTNFDEMAMKTVLSKALRTYGVQTETMALAYASDQAVLKPKGDVEDMQIVAEYNDNPVTIVETDEQALADIKEEAADE